MHVLWGNLQEAIECYNEAIKETEKSNDSCWLSGARQGKATAILLEMLYECNYEFDEEKLPHDEEIENLLTKGVQDL